MKKLRLLIFKVIFLENKVLQDKKLFYNSELFWPIEFAYLTSTTIYGPQCIHVIYSYDLYVHRICMYKNLHRAKVGPSRIRTGCAVRERAGPDDVMVRKVLGRTSLPLDGPLPPWRRQAFSDSKAFYARRATERHVRLHTVTPYLNYSFFVISVNKLFVKFIVNHPVVHQLFIHDPITSRVFQINRTT